MKKIVLFLALGAFSLTTFAQDGDENEGRQPQEGDNAISLNFAGLANLALNSGTDPFNGAQTLDYRRFIANGLALRFGFGVNVNSTKTTTVSDSTGGLPLTETENKNSTSAFSLACGVEKHIKTKSKTIDPYVGGGVYLSMLGKNKVTNMSKTTQPNGAYSESIMEQKIPGGFGFGLGGNAGFFWFFADNIALGAEYGFGFGMGITGGDTETTNTSKSVASDGSVLFENESTTTSNSKTTNIGLLTGSSGLINLLVNF